MKYCKKCLMPDSRPRIVFNDKGICNACLWAEEKKTRVNWEARWQELTALCDKYKKLKKSDFDCIIPVSGGKDSSYVAYMMREKLGMHPLCVTIRPALEYDIGKRNLRTFINYGYDHIHVTPNTEVSKTIDRDSFIKYGRPMHAWMIAVQATIFRIAVLFNIPFVMFGEEGETEYGGTTKLKKKACYNLEDSLNIYLSGFNPNKYLNQFSGKELYFWSYPSLYEIRNLNLAIAHWSYFEDWDPYKHYLLAKDKLGMIEQPNRNIGTYTNYGQNDTKLYPLYTYLMYLKFGFGRCTQDVGIDIRRGAMTREKGISLVKMYDGEYPDSHIEEYLQYFDMNQEEFDEILYRHTNKELFVKKCGKWMPTFSIK